MTTIWQDGFSHYGDDAASPAVAAKVRMGEGPWAIAQGQCRAPSWGARTGSLAYSVGSQDDNGGIATRRVLGGSVETLIVSMGFSVSNLPDNNNFVILKPRDGSNASICGLRLRTDGVLILEAPLGVPVAVTQAPVIRGQTWHALEMSFGFTDQTFRLDVDGTTVMDISGVAYPEATAEQLAIGAGTAPGPAMGAWFSDLITRDALGTVNNGFEGDVRVVTLFPDADAPVQGWAKRPLKNVGQGVAANLFNQAAAAANSTTVTDLGAGDFTIEQFVRFSVLPTASNISAIFGKWDEAFNRRSYQLFLSGPGLGSELTLRMSTNGLAGTVANLISWPWAPELNRWYHVAAVRASGELLLFIEGIQQGLPVADTTTPFVGVAPTAMGGQVEDVPTTFAILNKGFIGWLDEVRLTVGYARYTTDFTPPSTPFPRTVGGDPQFAMVALLCGFDNNSLADESSHGFTIRGNAFEPTVPVTPDDGVFNFQDINSPTPRDYTFIEAALTPASSIFTQTALPSNNETVTVGTKSTGPATPAVYRFRTALSVAYDVLIGATISDTLQNLLNAINLGPGIGATYGAGTLVNNDVVASGLPSGQMTVTANIPGTAGNALTTTTTAADGSWTGATLSGGADIPGPSEFYFQRPPPDTTVVKAVTIINRSFKNDTGTCSLQVSFVGPDDGALDGADNALTIAPSYREDIFEEDPDTGDPLSVTSVTSGRVRLNRTA